MGMFMQSVSFFRPNDWQQKRVIVETLMDASGIDMVCSNLAEESSAYGIVDAYGSKGPIFEELAQSISEKMGGFVVYAICVDSDFDILTIFCDGEILDRSVIGNVCEEMLDGMPVGEPKLSCWKQLPGCDDKVAEMQAVMYGEEVFAEDHLRKLSTVTGLPIFDDGIFEAAENASSPFGFGFCIDG